MEKFKTAKLFDAGGDLSQRWFVYYNFRSPETGKYRRFRHWVPQNILTAGGRRDKAHEIIKSINRSGATILLVEQNARKALAIADHAFIMESGRIVLEGTPEKLLENEDVQEFYLGVKQETSVKGFQRYKRKKRWR